MLSATTVVILGLGVRLFIIAGNKSVDGHNLTKATREAFMGKQNVIASRGKIFDSDGQVLAENTTVYNMYAILNKNQKDTNGKPLYVTDKSKVARQLSKVINLKEKEIYKRLSSKHFQVEFGTAGKNLTIAQHNKIEKMKLTGISFTSHQARTYPNDQMASHLIGNVNMTEKSNGQSTITGTMGIEAAANTLLSGKNGIKSYIGQKADSSQSVKNGDNVYLTLDSSLQTTLETRMDTFVKSTKPARAVAVLMEAKTGRIVAATQRPNFNPNNKATSPTVWSNLLDQGAFEPGSTMKGITMAAAIDTGKWQPNATFQSGTYLIDGKQVTDSFGNDQGVMTYREGFWRSSNVAFAKTEQKIGSQTWRNYLEKFKFLQSTQSGLNGEESGSFSFSYGIDQANTAFGQAIRVTPLQMIQAYSAIANNGKEIRPYFIDKVVDSATGEIVKQGKTKTVAHPIKASTAKQVRKYMIDVVNKSDGTAKEFDLRDYGYQIAAKTGTAQISKNGQYSQTYKDAIHSVMVLAPEKNPKYIFYMAVQQPSQLPDGDIQPTMSKLFKPLMLQALNDSDSAVKSKTTKQTVPNVVGKSVADAKSIMTKAGFRVALVGSKGKVNSQSLQANQKSLTNQLVILTAKGNTYMPNMIGWSLVDAQSFARQVGFKLTWDGSGYITQQSVGENQLIVKSSVISIALKEKE
ncbi:penicillin-binding protein 2B [Leuconostoc litchii]|uniref:penicillin-binding protein n=1 Tax=Leuconostoc litchii TaxID=1981069 RepID=UPI0023E9A7A6|nr:penicillin-binding transpeptidase domain-containing protein [Leuconostoc litchii]GMA70445.1 penicillin-binding protein 2B [Leuconostoc litchii]